MEFLGVVQTPPLVLAGVSSADDFQSVCDPMQVWYPMTVCTNSWYQKKAIHKAGLRQ